MDTNRHEGGARGRIAAELKALMLAEPPLTLAVAESLTCGRVQARVGEVSGASDYFWGGITAYRIKQKAKHLGVNEAEADAVNAVSPEIAEQMARGVCTLFGTTLGLATTGYAEPSLDRNVREPYAWCAVVHARSADNVVVVRRKRIECAGATRVEAQAIVADAALAELVAYLWEWRQGSGK